MTSPASASQPPCPAGHPCSHLVRPGDRVRFQADEEYWHGAAPNRLMVHLVVDEGDDDHAVVHWLNPVTDEECAAVPATG
ncbi:hypothetical protein AB0L55_33255 [Streptomyces anthocyanicus]|uniref:hypothetical protein n=1 Tax=Streptomyces anthocyanicus TaxID=68174 RepID=UPI003441E41B